MAYALGLLAIFALAIAILTVWYIVHDSRDYIRQIRPWDGC